MRISYAKDDGSRRYWDGSAFQDAGPVDLATTIDGAWSSLAFQLPEETKGRTVEYEGWVVKNGKRTPSVYRETTVSENSYALGFG